MNLEAIKKLVTSSKVLMFALFAVAITVALEMGLVDSEWWKETLANAYYALMGGYSLVEAARAVLGKKGIAVGTVVPSADAREVAAAAARVAAASGEVLDAAMALSSSAAPSEPPGGGLDEGPGDEPG